MILSDYREARKILQEKVISYYGLIGKEDMKGFIIFCTKDEDLKKANWKLGKPLPFDIAELVDCYIQYDSYYFEEIEYEEQEYTESPDIELEKEYRRSAL